MPDKETERFGLLCEAIAQILQTIVKIVQTFHAENGNSEKIKTP